MATLQTVMLLRNIWAAEVIPLLDADLERVKLALIHAETLDAVRALQGRATALISMVRLPEHLAAQLTEETNGHG